MTKGCCIGRKFTGASCAIAYHDDMFFGLCRSDHRDVFGRSCTNWVPPNDNKIQSNIRRVNAIKRVVEEEAEAAE